MKEVADAGAASAVPGLVAFPITPADEGGRVDVAGLQRLLERLGAAGVDGVGLLGSTGTYAYLSREERRRAVAAAVECLGGRVPIVVGAGALRTDAAVLLARDAEAAGADGLLLAPVSYTPLLEEEVFQHFRAVARGERPADLHLRQPDDHELPLPAGAGRAAGGLAARRGAEDPGGRAEFAATLAALRARVPPDFAVGCSGDWAAADALLGGADAWHSVVGGLLPRPALALTRAAQAGDRPEAARLDERLPPAWELFRELSSLRVVYAAAEILGLARRPRLPGRSCRSARRRAPASAAPSRRWPPPNGLRAPLKLTLPATRREHV